MNYRERVQHFYKLRRDEGLRPQQALLLAKFNAKYGKGSKKLLMMPDQHVAYDGEEITTLPNGWEIKVEFQRDDDCGAPWEEHDGHGVVYETHSREEHMDDWVLHSDWRYYRYYDWKASLKIAIKDKWGTKPYDTSTAMDAVKADYEFLRRWCNDDWWWVGMIVTLLDENDEELAEDSCWGYDSDSIDYLCSEARSWAARMIVKARRKQRNAHKQELIESRFHDAMENAL